jgi:serine protease Do
MIFSTNKTLRYSLLTLFLALALGLTQCQAQTEQPPAKKDTSAGTTTAAAQVNASALKLSTAIAKVAREAMPAVVHIEVTQSQEVSNPLFPFENQPFFHYFFNTPGNMPRKFKRQLRALGSGMIMDSQGHILTNNHVVAGANEIQVTMADGLQYKGTVVGTDPKTDLAVVQIHAGKELPHVTFADSDKIAVGDWVVAIGDPRGLDQTVTQGIISAKHRHGILDPSSYQDYLQTDAAINPGNSGGPLLNLQGQVVGVNSAIMTESGGFEGIGFAIPSNMAVHIARELIKNGKVTRGWLGVSVRDVTSALARSKKLKVTSGALVVEVVKDGPAAKAGFRKNDVVTAYEGQPIPDASTLRDKVANTTIGQEVTLTVQRDSKRIDLKVKIGNLEEAVAKLAASAEERLGVIVRPVTKKEVQSYGLHAGLGVAIKSLQSNGPLAEAGFEVNDVILAINNIPIEGVEGFASLVNALPPHQQVVLQALDHRTGETGNVEVETR